MADRSTSRPLVSGVLPDPLEGFSYARDWIGGEGRAREFLGFLRSGEEWRHAVAGRDARRGEPLAPEETAEIVAFNEACGNRAGAQLAGQLADTRALAVVTGQQPDLLAAPLYVLLKALSAIDLARRIGEACGDGRPVVPIFWVASDDHDFHELRDCRLGAPDGGMRNLGELVSRGDAPEGSPAFEWRLDGKSVAALVRAADQVLPPGPEGDTARALVRSALGGSAPDFETVFCRTLAALLGEALPMVFVTPRMAWMRRRQRHVLRADFERPREAARLLEESGERMAEAGYPPRLYRDEDVLNAFYLHDRARMRLVLEGEEIVAENAATHEAGRRFSREELLAELDAHPERFSPNVVTRPMVQDSALPTVAYVGGPGEVSYLAQLAPVYEAFGMPRAAVTLRASATLVPASTARELEALGVQAQSTGGSPGGEGVSLDSALGDRLMELAPTTAPLLTALREFEAESERRVAALWSAAGATPRPQHLHSSLAKTAFSIRQALEHLRTRLWRQMAAEGGEVWKQYLRATALLQPSGPPQERTLAPHNFLTGYGEPSALARELAGKMDFGKPGHQVITLGAEDRREAEGEA